MQRQTIYASIYEFLKTNSSTKTGPKQINDVTIRVLKTDPFLFTDDNIHFFELGTSLEKLTPSTEDKDSKTDNSNWLKLINQNQKMVLKAPSISLRKVPYKHEWFFNISCKGLQVIRQKDTNLNNSLLDKLELKSPLEDEELNYRLKILNRKLTEKIVRRKFMDDSSFGAPIKNNFQGEGEGPLLRKRESAKPVTPDSGMKKVKTESAVGAEDAKENRVNA